MHDRTLHLSACSSILKTTRGAVANGIAPVGNMFTDLTLQESARRACKAYSGEYSKCIDVGTTISGHHAAHCGPQRVRYGALGPFGLSLA